LMAAVGAFGLTMALAVPRVSAQVTTFSTKNYSGNYGCTLKTTLDAISAVIQYHPDGNGGYTSGTLVASLQDFLVAYNPAAPAGQFCTYFLQTGASAYSIDSTGVGFETLSWAPSVANPAGCGPAAGTFIDQDAIVLRNITTPVASIRAETADANLFDRGTAAPPNVGHGSCLGG
jgi:hypothetical protein